MTKEFIGTVLGLILNIPVWAIVFFFATQSVKRRNDVEKRIGQTLDAMKKDVSTQNEKIAILNTKLEYYERSQFNK